MDTGARQATRSTHRRADPRLTDPIDWGDAARALSQGAVIGHGFANMYAITARADRDTVRRVNVMKGRPPDQVGSLTSTPSRIAELFDWAELPAGLTRRSVLSVMDCFWGIGPFGFRGPAAATIPEHLTFRDGAALTTQVIAPGYACPSNAFLARSLAVTGDDLLFITSANRSRHLNGTDDSPPHWRAASSSSCLSRTKSGS
jgi:tRNA A37 threonylcarbamoyladenosine synthetase subunit TsaC/SUA5/YrdC